MMAGASGWHVQATIWVVGVMQGSYKLETEREREFGEKGSFSYALGESIVLWFKKQFCLERLAKDGSLASRTREKLSEIIRGVTIGIRARTRDGWCSAMDALQDVHVLKKVVLQGSSSGPGASSSKAAHVPDGEKVSITNMYLTGDAKLWWRTRMEDEQSREGPKSPLGDSEEGIE
ncbi:hypothetical protein CK203_102033 [Vitis vinifera]|uniref:Uncharacterized protein n=1 Tax=Vitis vinifera TaxID=29760 RepID=A0A438D8I3_VITVI|nr:hypothetical protein CK203_102033 [Vitis vinifera]